MDMIPNVKRVQTAKGELVVREIVLEDVLRMTEELMSLVALFDKTTFESDPMVFMATLLQQPELLKRIQRILGELTDTSEETFHKFPVKDLLKVLEALFEVNDFEEVKRLFFVLKGRVHKQPTA